MNDLIKILMVEDSATDAELVCRALTRDGLTIESRRAETRPVYIAALGEFQPHIILSDFSMPQFDGLSALALAQDICPDTPFMFVSGTISEDTAIAALRGGATDYVQKDNLKRLPSSVRRALDEVRMRLNRVQAESRFHDLIEFSPSAIVVLDEQGTIQIVNACTEALFGYAREDILGRSCELLVPDRCAQLRAALSGTPPRGGHQPRSSGFEAMGRHSDGRLFPAEINLSPLKVASGLWVSCVIADLTERNAQQQRISRLNRIQTALSNINAAAIRTREHDVLCQRACEIAVTYGQFEFAWIGMMKPMSDEGVVIAWDGAKSEYFREIRLSSDITAPEGNRLVSRAIRAKAPIICNDVQNDPTMAAFARKALEYGFGSIVALPLIINDVAEGVIALYAKGVDFFNAEEMVLLDQLAADISFAIEHQKSQSRLSYLAYFDSPTDLPNRTLFQERLQILLAPDAARQQEQIAVVLIDIDRFRNINDTLGRDAGNILLKEVGDRLGSCLSEPQYLARIDSNCFAFIALCGPDRRRVADLLELQLAPRLAEPVHLAGKEIRISIKAGIAIYPLDGADGDTLVRNADAALRRAKLSKLPHVFYDAGMNADLAVRLSVENRLKTALDQNQFTLHYQPKIDLASDKLVGLEALIRWNAPGQGLVPPVQFIQVLEDTGLIIEVGTWVIAEAYRQHREWTERGLAPPRIAVNVSQLQMRQNNFVEQVLDIIEGGSADALEIEITETLFMENLDDSIEKLGRLRNAGITVAIDDFGTGYSSLSYIARLPIDTLKIDRSFIVDIATSADHMAVVSTIIGLAHALKLKVVAEGVETPEQSHLLKLMRCDQIQGFISSRPLPASEIDALLRNQIP